MSKLENSSSTPFLCRFPGDDGGASSINIALPHFSVAQAGASRSVSPLRLRTARRFLEARRSGFASSYLSIKRAEGTVTYV